MLAGLSHLPADLVCGGTRDRPDWPLPLLWPFSHQGWAYPILDWGDLGPVLIFIGAMFALYHWPARAQLIACASLLALAGYLATRWAIDTF
jgi:hypothetical protein